MSITTIDFPSYQRLQAVNWSTLRLMLKSPRHYQWGLKHPRLDTPRLGLGRAVHTAVFEPERFATDYEVWPWKRGAKGWKEFKARHAGKTIITMPERELVIGMRDSVLSTLHARMHLELGRAEQTIEWVDKATGIKCKARLDWISDSMPSFLDLKSASTVDAILFGNAAARLCYHGQIGFYHEALIAIGETRDPYLLPVEKDPPHDCGLFKVDGDPFYAGKAIVRELLDRAAQCRDRGEYPGRFSEEQLLTIPAWSYGSEDDVDDLGIMSETETAEETTDAL